VSSNRTCQELAGPELRPVTSDNGGAAGIRIGLPALIGHPKLADRVPNGTVRAFPKLDRSGWKASAWLIQNESH